MAPPMMMMSSTTPRKDVPELCILVVEYSLARAQNSTEINNNNSGAEI